MHTPARAIAWLWVNAGAGAAFALPAAVAAMANPALGFALAVGVLPPAAIGLRAPRRERVLIALLGGGIITAFSVPLIVQIGSLWFGIGTLIITVLLILWGVLRKREKQPAAG